VECSGGTTALLSDWSPLIVCWMETFMAFGAPGLMRRPGNAAMGPRWVFEGTGGSCGQIEG
jgi:hypothetical protein